MAKRPMRFRAMKYTIRGAFFSAYFIVRMLSKFVKYLQRIKTEALSPMGTCPHCKSPDLDYGDWYIKGQVAYFPFNCGSCKHVGTERYSLRYVASVLERNENGQRDTGTHHSDLSCVEDPREYAGNAGEDD